MIQLEEVEHAGVTWQPIRASCTTHSASGGRLVKTQQATAEPPPVLAPLFLELLTLSFMVPFSASSTEQAVATFITNTVMSGHKPKKTKQTSSTMYTKTELEWTFGVLDAPQCKQGVYLPTAKLSLIFQD